MNECREHHINVTKDCNGVMPAIMESFRMTAGFGICLGEDDQRIRVWKHCVLHGAHLIEMKSVACQLTWCALGAEAFRLFSTSATQEEDKRHKKDKAKIVCILAGMPESKNVSVKTREVSDTEKCPVLKGEQKNEANDLNFHASAQLDEKPSSQSADKTTHRHSLHLAFQNPQLTQNRPSVLCSTSLLPLGPTGCSQLSKNLSKSAFKTNEKSSGYISSPALMCTNPHKSAVTPTNSLVQSEVLSCLFVNDRCCWPGCDEAFEEYSAFLKHLNHRHSCGEKTIAQWRVQQERVRHMENQLIQEKQRLQAMQFHLRLSEHTSTHARAALGWWSPLAAIMPPSEEPDGGAEWASDIAGHQEYWPTPAPHLLSDFMNSIGWYKYVNIRPPYTYAFLIRWSILEAPDKQRALNEIYNWFIQKFFYFRHNTPTWKNAVRHNLSLHKCFVRVDGGKGAVWTVDEKEFQKRKGQKFNRDSALKWLPTFSQLPQVS
ncbi:forkhead box protein P3 [Hoplias malabaricus]|uniref:forkhead box protein P3 n=1 Tax=Hoplias malabaricus TaxID=27720 RepID=UPI0034625C98